MKQIYNEIKKINENAVQEKSKNVNYLAQNPYQMFFEMEEKIDSKDFDKVQNILSTTPLSMNERISLVLNTLYTNAGKMLAAEKLERLLLLSGRTQSGLHLLVLGNPAIGKTTTLIRTNPMAERVSPEVTEPVLIYNIKDKSKGLITTKNMLVFDDIHEVPLTKINSFLMDYLETGNIKRCNEQTDNTSNTNLYFIGNMTEVLQKELLMNPYDITPSNIWECPEDSIFQKEGFQSRLFPLVLTLGRDDCFKISENTVGIHLNIFNNICDFLKKTHLSKPLNSNASNNTRSNVRVYRITEALLKIIYFSLENIDPFLTSCFQQIVESYTLFSETGKLKLIGTPELDFFWIVASENWFPYPILSIKEAWVDWDRVMLRFSEKPEIIYKIATTRIGIEKNKKEIDLWKKASTFAKEHLIKIEKEDEENIIIKAFSSEPPYGTARKFDLTLLKKYVNFPVQDKTENSSKNLNWEEKSDVKELEKKIHLLISEMKLEINAKFRDIENRTKIGIRQNTFWTEEDSLQKKNKLKEKLATIFKIPISSIRDYDIIIPNMTSENLEVQFLNYHNLEYVNETSNEMIHELNKKLNR